MKSISEQNRGSSTEKKVLMRGYFKTKQHEEHGGTKSRFIYGEKRVLMRGYFEKKRCIAEQKRDLIDL